MKLSKIVNQWIRYARTDLRVAKFNLEKSTEFKSSAAFHAQQCAEKAVKGYLAFNKVRFQKTHDLKALTIDLSNINPILAKKISKAKSLTKYAVIYRYPDAERKPLTVAQVKSAIKIAENVFEKCIEAIRESKI